MERIALQQPEALASLYDRHRGAVYGICARVLGPGADAEEILEEVFFEVWQRPQRYDPTRSAPLSYLAVMARSPQVVGLLVRSGAALDASASRGVTPLHLAAMHGDAAIIQTLLRAGADPDAPNQNGRTPIQVAARNGHEAVLLPSVAAE